MRGCRSHQPQFVLHRLWPGHRNDPLSVFKISSIEGGASRLTRWTMEKLADANSGTAEDQSGVIDNNLSPMPTGILPTGAKLVDT